MGNYVSCIPTIGRPGVTIADWEGNIRPFATPATAADLMLEAPGNLVSRAEDVRRTRRFMAMKADEELRPGEVYLMFPIDKVGSKAPGRQMAVVCDVLLGGKGRRQRKEKRETQRRRSGRVCPVVVGDDKEEEVKYKGMGGNSNCGFARMGLPDGAVTGFPMRCRFRGNLRWMPVLDTISESC